jgi:hypothetical protein
MDGSQWYTAGWGMSSTCLFCCLPTNILVMHVIPTTCEARLAQILNSEVVNRFKWRVSLDGVSVTATLLPTHLLWRRCMHEAAQNTIAHIWLQ